jgi:hypothetical protein
VFFSFIGTYYLCVCVAFSGVVVVRAQVTQVSSGSAAGAASGDGDDDDDEGDEGGDGDTNLITGECKAYTWGSGGWGQLGRASNKTPDSGTWAMQRRVCVLGCSLLLFCPRSF